MGVGCYIIAIVGVEAMWAKCSGPQERTRLPGSNCLNWRHGCVCCIGGDVGGGDALVRCDVMSLDPSK